MGMFQLSPSATWELQQLVLLLQIDPQNVGVNTIDVGLDPGKIDRLSNSVCQTLGIKIKTLAKAELAKPPPPDILWSCHHDIFTEILS